MATFRLSVRAMKAGAVDFLPKPFRDVEILDAVNSAINRDRERRKEQQFGFIRTFTPGSLLLRRANGGRLCRSSPADC